MINWFVLRQHLLGERPAGTLPLEIKMPTLPTAVTKVCEACSDPNTSAGTIAKILESDTALTCDVLKYVNASSHGLRNKVNSVQRAVALLGLSATRLMVVTAATRRLAESCKSPLIVSHRFSVSGLERAHFARAVAQQMKVDADLAFAGSLLQDFLLPTLTVQLTRAYTEFSQTPAASRQSLHEFERAKFKWDHGEAGARVMLSWKFPDDLICCVLIHHELDVVREHPQLQQSAALPCALAGLMPDLLQQIPNGHLRLLELQSSLPNINLEDAARSADESLRTDTPDLRGHKTLHEQWQAIATPAA